MSHIFHITTAADWANAQSHGSYIHDSLAAEGFIHMSSEGQVVATTGRYYSDTPGLVLLEIDPSRLSGPSLVWEESTNGELFPHLYEALPLSAVVAVHDWDASMTAPPNNG